MTALARGSFGADALRLTESLDLLREGLQIIGPDWRYLYLNEGVTRHGRRSREDLLGKTMLECYPGIEDTPMFSVLQSCMQGRRSANLENEFVFPDGDRGWFELRVQPCPEGLLVLSVDITERKRLEASLREGEKLRALGQMASGVAYDLRNLLNPLMIQVEVLRRRLSDSEDALPVLEQMAGVLRRGTQTINLLQDVGRQSPVPAADAVDLNAIAREAVKLMLPHLTERMVPVSLEEALDAVPLVRVNPSELLSAVFGLLVNALDAMPGGGRITVRTGLWELGAWLEVEDTGAGMTPEVQARAFEPFFTTKGERGIGLGLATVYALAARHQGNVRLRTAIGEGTCVTLQFPRVA
jgi:signal transduction histidine kinase